MNHNENKRNTIIYGGAFNPPTRAHQAILQACVDHAAIINADVWLLPSGDRSDKTIGTSRDMRIRLLKALTSDVVARVTSVHIDTTELDRAVPTETFDTVLEMNDRHPDRQFLWVFGSDSVESMSSWHMGEWMLENLSMLVVERPGTPVRTLGRYATILHVETDAISSTDVRERLKKGARVQDLVSPNVHKILHAV